MSGSLQLQSGYVKSSLREKLSDVHGAVMSSFTEGCKKHHAWMSMIFEFVADGSDETKQRIESLRPPIELQEILDFKTQLEALRVWDQAHFRRREDIVRELDAVVVSLTNIGTQIYQKITVDMEEDFAPAKETLKMMDDATNEYTALLEKKLEVPPPPTHIHDRNATQSSNQQGKLCCKIWRSKSHQITRNTTSAST